MLLRVAIVALGALSLAACATPGPTPGPLSSSWPPPSGEHDGPIRHHERKPSPPAATETPPVAEAPAAEPTARVELASLPGWAAEDHLAAFEAFRQTCTPQRRPALAQLCRAAKAMDGVDPDSARQFFEANFQAEAAPGQGVLTGYFAPIYEARHYADEVFNAPVRPKPADLAIIDMGKLDPAQAGRPGAATVQDDGSLKPYADRAEIEARPAGDALAWMRPEELFFLQVQGSGVLVFEDGTRMKALYAANNGRPFVGIANPLRDRGALPKDGVSADAIRQWLADHRGGEANAVMRLNPRYAFFNLAPDDGKPPVGAANVPLPGGRAIAVDPVHNPLGELFWIDAAAPTLAGAYPNYRRLVVALDTGGAIKGPVRADFYVGEGDRAGVEAGRIRHTLKMLRLVPRDITASETARAHPAKGAPSAGDRDALQRKVASPLAPVGWNKPTGTGSGR